MTNKIMLVSNETAQHTTDVGLMINYLSMNELLDMNFLSMIEGLLKIIRTVEFTSLIRFVANFCDLSVF